MSDITLQQLQESEFNWPEAFAYAGEQVDWGDGTPTIGNIPGADVSTEPFTRADISELLGAIEGENDEESWYAYGKLKDGRYFYLEAWCDYTGWG